VLLNIIAVSIFAANPAIKDLRDGGYSLSFGVAFNILGIFLSMVMYTLYRMSAQYIHAIRLYIRVHFATLSPPGHQLYFQEGQCSCCDSFQHSIHAPKYAHRVVPMANVQHRRLTF
jgi:hypothetical protein